MEQGWMAGGPYELRLERDGKGRIVRKAEITRDETRQYSYGYDAVGQLTEVKLNGGLCEAYEYDMQGRRSRSLTAFPQVRDRAYGYDKRNRLVQVGPDWYTHDQHGFRSGRFTQEGNTLYHYARDGRLLGADLPDGTELAFRHDIQGRRIAKIVNGIVVEQYHWQDRIRMAKARINDLDMEFHYAQGARLPLAASINDRRFSLHHDQVGSLCAVADESGDMIQEIVYEAFGRVLENTNPNLRIPLGFAGGLYDPDLGWVRFGFRDYEPATGRFTASDPLGLAGGDPDVYGYCLDDPVNNADPAGLDADCVSFDLNANGFGGRAEAGLGVCWDDNNEFRPMGHMDIGAGSGWGVGASGTYQTTNAKDVDELAGESMAVGGSYTFLTPYGDVSIGQDKIFAPSYQGKAYSVGFGKGSRIPEAHATHQETWLFGKSKK